MPKSISKQAHPFIRTMRIYRTLELERVHTIIRPSAAHNAAFFARPYDTPNSSRTVVNDCRSEIKDSAEITFAIVRWAKK